MKLRTLYIPVNISLEKELWRGLSMKDSAKGLLAMIIAIVAAVPVVLFFQLDPVYGVFGVMAVTIVTLGMHQKLGNSVNYSIMDIIKIATRYQRKQKRYYYFYRR